MFVTRWSVSSAMWSHHQTFCDQIEAQFSYNPVSPAIAKILARILNVLKAMPRQLL